MRESKARDGLKKWRAHPAWPGRVLDRSMGRLPAWGRRLAWLLIIWTASVCALALAAWFMRLFMQLAGMRPG